MAWRVLQLGEDPRRKDVLVMRRVALAGAHGAASGRRSAGQQRDMRALATFRQRVMRLEPVAAPAQIGSRARRELVTGSEEQLRAKTLEQRAPALVTGQCRSQRTDTLRRHDGDEPCLP